MDEAMKKSGLIWVSTPDQPGGRAFWHAWLDGEVYLLTGSGEQPDPDWSREARPVVEVARAQQGQPASPVTWDAIVTRCRPRRRDWEPRHERVGGGSPQPARRRHSPAAVGPRSCRGLPPPACGAARGTAGRVLRREPPGGAGPDVRDDRRPSALGARQTWPCRPTPLLSARCLLIELSTTEGLDKLDRRRAAFEGRTRVSTGSTADESRNRNLAGGDADDVTGDMNDHGLSTGRLDPAEQRRRSTHRDALADRVCRLADAQQPDPTRRGQDPDLPRPSRWRGPPGCRTRARRPATRHSDRRRSLPRTA